MNNCPQTIEETGLPGKPSMAERPSRPAISGLPGNPVSSMVCGQLFMLPLLRAMMGLGARPAARLAAPLARDVGPNGPREHYMRAQLTEAGIVALDRQDSSLLSVLSQADALLVRPVGDGPRIAGEMVEYVPL